MKKILTALFVVLMALTLVGCSKKQEKSYNDFTDMLGQKGKISVGISPDYPPFESYDSNNNLIGFDVELFKELVNIINKQNGTNLEVEYVPMEFDTIISAIQTGQVDYGCSGFTYDEEREKSVLFTDKYLASSIVAMVKKDSGIKSIDDLKNKKIAAQTGTTCEEAAKTYTNDVSAIKDVNVMMEAFKADAYDAVFLDEPVAKNYENESLVIINQKVEDNDTYIILDKNNDLLLYTMNAAIEDFLKTDAYNELVAKWGVK